MKRSVINATVSKLTDDEYDILRSVDKSKQQALEA